MLVFYILKISNIFIINKELIIFNENSYINYILIIFILISLMFTFNKKSTIVHKVLGLLLTSILVVFLWILKTQFLFVYLVYILAFISAVLMLFLSVVLMLPISTNIVRSKFKLQKKTTLIFIFIDYNFDVLIKFIVVILLILLVILYCVFTYNIKIQYKDFNYIKILINKFFSPLTLIFYNIYNSIIRSDNRQYFFVFFNIDTMYLMLKYNVINFINYILKYSNLFIELILQFISYFSLFILILSSFLFKQTWLNTIVNDLNFDISLGLGQLKVLLYGDFSLFLIFSTIVLLIALIGSAIMTRSER